MEDLRSRWCMSRRKRRNSSVSEAKEDSKPFEQKEDGHGHSMNILFRLKKCSWSTKKPRFTRCSPPVWLRQSIPIGRAVLCSCFGTVLQDLNNNEIHHRRELHPVLDLLGYLETEDGPIQRRPSPEEMVKWSQAISVYYDDVSSRTPTPNSYDTRKGLEYMVHIISKGYSALEKEFARILIGFPLGPILKSSSPYLM